MSRSWMYTKRQSHQGQTKLLDIKYNFNLDRLPVKFRLASETSEDDTRHLSKAIGEFVDFIHKAGNHRFTVLRTYRSPKSIYYYCCCQDSSLEIETDRVAQRDRHKMARFPCDSRLKMEPDLVSRQMIVSLHHKFHEHYVDIRMSQAALDFIAMNLDHTPAQIYQDLEASSIPSDDITEDQVYYRWRCANSSIWQRDADQFVSTANFLTEQGNTYQHGEPLTDNQDHRFSARSALLAPLAAFTSHILSLS